MLLTLEGELCLCPKAYGANRVLDIGTGTGIWSLDYAELHPGAEVSLRLSNQRSTWPVLFSTSGRSSAWI